MAEAIIRVIWGTNRGKYFCDSSGRDEGWKKQLGSEPKIYLCEAPENPHELYSALTNLLGEVIDSRDLFYGYEIGVRDVNLLCWLALLKQTGALLHPVFAPIFRTAERELSLLESFDVNATREAKFSRYEEVVEVLPYVRRSIPLV